ncbi:hypothetical protein BDR07DRAFT_1405535 [Suillus spraguei]|nr:hypothetical protein BDR07DRAFT_1405535 [Suillus spraguei]
MLPLEQRFLPLFLTIRTMILLFFTISELRSEIGKATRPVISTSESNGSFLVSSSARSSPTSLETDSH